jgi:branched-chain amino acid transport system substrate-binding protein
MVIETAKKNAAVVLTGATLPLTGAHSVQGREARRGLEIWLREVNAAGGVIVEGRRRPVRVRLLDDRSSAERALRNVEMLLAEGVDLLFGPYGRSAGLAVTSAAQRAGVIVWNHGCSADDVAQPMVVTLPTAASQYLMGTLELARTRGCQSVLLAVTEGPFGHSVARGAVARAASIGLHVRVLPIPARAWEARHADIVADSVPRTALMLCGGLKNEVDTVAALKAAQAEPTLVGAVGAGVRQFGQALGVDAAGVVGPSQWEVHHGSVDLGPTGTEMVLRYREQHAAEPDYVAVQSWASGIIAEAALAVVGLDPGALWEWALSFRGTTGYGEFALSREGRQVGHRLRLVEWDAKRHRRVIA